MKNATARPVVPNSILKVSALEKLVHDARSNCERKLQRKRSSPRRESGLPNILSVLNDSPAFAGGAFFMVESEP